LLALQLALGLTLAGCGGDGGYAVMVDNRSPRDLIVVFVGRSMTLPDGRYPPEDVGFLARAGVPPGAGPSVSLAWSNARNDWESGAVYIFDSGCRNRLAKFDVRPGSYVITVDGAGTATVDKYRAGNFPPETVQLPHGAPCPLSGGFEPP
jgi:hypothetical protein